MRLRLWLAGLGILFLESERGDCSRWRVAVFLATPSSGGYEASHVPFCRGDSRCVRGERHAMTESDTASHSFAGRLHSRHSETARRPYTSPGTLTVLFCVTTFLNDEPGCRWQPNFRIFWPSERVSLRPRRKEAAWTASWTLR